MPTTPPHARVTHLRSLLGRANRAYYIDANPIMPDAEFDTLLAELSELERQHPQLADPTSPTQRVGGQPIKGFRTLRHAQPMLSIDNTYTESDVREWYARVLRGLKVDAPADGLFAAPALPKLVCDPKIDGVALSLRYEHGQLIHAVTRGDGTAGDDVTHVARTINSIPLQLDAGEISAKNQTVAVPDVLEIRGEVYLPLPVFNRLNTERQSSGEEPFMNPRNAAAGALKQLDPKAAALRKLAFSAHGKGEVVPAKGKSFVETHAEFMRFLRSFGVATKLLPKPASTIDDALDEIRAFDATRRALDYATDGMVVRLDSFTLQDALGTNSKSPRWVIAFKYPADRKTTTLIRVEHQVGKTGKITPRAVMEPVLIAGSVVRHATLHNYGQIKKRDIHIGDIIEIEKAGEVIPYVVGVAPGQRSKKAVPVMPPDRCPVCDAPVDIEFGDAVGEGRPEDETGRFCLNPECPAQIYEKLVWFAGRRQMDIAGLGEQTIEVIRRESEVPLNAFTDIYKLKDHRQELLALERMGDKKIDNLLAGIEESKSRGLARVLAGLGIRHVGDTTAKLLARRYRDIDSLLVADERTLRPKSLKKNEALALGFAEATADRPETGLGKDTAKAVHEYLHSPAARRLFTELHAVGVDLTSRDFIEPHAATASSRPLAGQTFVITGTLENHEREELKAKLESLGARVSGSASKKTSVVIVGESPGSKLDKARELGITTWDEDKLNQELARLQPPLK